MSLLRESFGGINARFHLVGFYTLSALLLRITIDYAGSDPELAGLVGTALVLFHGTACGILGLVVQAASGRKDEISFARYAWVLFLPLLWLSLKAGLIVFGLVGFVVGGYSLAQGAVVPLEELRGTVFFYGGPLIGLAVQVLMLYSLPLCIVSRERGERRAHVREGWAMLRAAPAESRQLLLLLLLIALLGGALQYSRGPHGQAAPPDIPEGIVLFLNSYLELVALFGAARVVLGRLDSGSRDDLPARSASSLPGPPA